MSANLFGWVIGAGEGNRSGPAIALNYNDKFLRRFSGYPKSYPGLFKPSRPTTRCYRAGLFRSM